ncbi:GNAT family N-acetyltransferase [Lewinella sp. 4G2]|uniref:GNAT family N-acetyltransferase n=1 Tax=Lewinella sp. 4G2 TaxID=1803372 RepID=UPI0007B4D973|nr:GNAT family N-acetyltransferase [Lewinella sp. 4G2]OAV45967.1 hypothetical protein A3850_018905 [Lewinella sp. 4G2]
MDLQPTLTGKTIRLRPLCAEDRAAFYAVTHDPLIWDQHPAKRYLPEVFAEFFEQSLKSGGCLLVEDLNTEEVIGSSRFQPLPTHTDIVEIGWTVLARAYWGGRTNREMKSLMVAHLTAQGKKACLNIAAGNYRSARAAEKIGGRLVGPDYYPTLIDPREGYRTYILPDVITKEPPLEG